LRIEEDAMPWSVESSVHRAGDVVPAGAYERVDGAIRRRIVLSRPGALPPSFDGQVALYRALPARPDPPPAGRRTPAVGERGLVSASRQPS
jgi:hypothetical protein